MQSIFLKTGVPVGSNPAPSFVNLFLFPYKSEWTGKMKSIDHHGARFGHVYRFIGDLIGVNDSKEFKNSFKEILKLKKENANDNAATFLNLNIKSEGG